jgi:hypothetical protein
MVFRNPSLYVAMLALVATSVNLACAQDVEAKGKKRSGSRSYFVPPPPAYTPSLTPAVYVNGQPQVAQTTTKKKKKEVEEKKYVYTREGYEQPKATKPNPYVTYWGS